MTIDKPVKNRKLLFSSIDKKEKKRYIDWYGVVWYDIVFTGKIKINA